LKIQFTKMHGIGNDFILIDCIRQTCPPETGYLRGLSERLCNRRLGIGADQVLLLYPSDIADFRMRILNADGSEVEMCGNGVRCLAKFIWDRKLSKKDILHIETLAGIIKPVKAGDMVKVDMGEPIFEPEKIPVNISGTGVGSQERTGNSKLKTRETKAVVDYPIRIKDREFKVTCVSTGNPHAIIVVDDVSSFPVPYYGPLVETHPIFPKKANVEFIQVLTRKELRMRVWERGSGETMACGTGASAAAVAARAKDLTDNAVTVHLVGGDLFIEWAEDNHVYMTGPAATVFEGEFDL